MAAARISSPTRHEYEESSSPDPLADSLNEGTSSVASHLRRRSAGPAISPSKLRQKKMSDIELSPSKMVAEQNLSPWRIKVTVEAEPEDGIQIASGDRRTHTVTKTMKVPLRDFSSEVQAVDEGRRSNTRTRNARRSSSPAQTRSRTRRKSVTDLDIVVLGDDEEEDAWTSKPKSPRKRRNSKKATSTSRKSGSGAFEIREDDQVQRSNPDTVEASDELESPAIKEINPNQVNTRARSNSAKDKETRNPTEKAPNTRKVSINSNASYPTPSPTASEHANSDTRDGSDVQQEPQVGMDTVMESEGFTMIDLDSLPSIKHIRNTPEYPSIPEEEAVEVSHQNSDESTNIEQATIEAPSIAVSNEDTNLSASDFTSSPPNGAGGAKSKKYSIAHLQLPSSTKVQRHRLITPMPTNANPYSSPKLPSPPRAPASISKERSPINSDQVVQAGSMLQNAVTPTTNVGGCGHKAGRNEFQEEEAVFGGFSSETRRELRAELRFGEELGKKLAEKGVQKEVTEKQYQPKPKRTSSNDFQVWRGETTVQRTPLTHVGVWQASARDSSAINGSQSSAEASLAANEARLEAKRQEERDRVVEQVKSSEAVIIDDDNQAEDRSQYDADETLGDIWLAEAQKTSSPRESVNEALPAKEALPDQARRKLIPSPWKRGQQIETSHLSADESFSGLFWKQQSSDVSSARFGDAIIANPEKAVPKVSKSERRRSGVYDAEQMVIRTPQRFSDHAYSDSDDQDIEDENFDDVRGNMQWRSAADVIEEETNALEAIQREQEIEDDEEHQGGGMTKLYETNLDGVPEQDLSSSPHVQFLENDRKQLTDHDSTYSSISGDESEILYKQRTSLSPSKQRPHTPRSAMKGSRASFGNALNFDDESEEQNPRRVVWAKRSSCMNESWEESTRSVKSNQTLNEDETPVPTERPNRQVLVVEPTFEVNPQPVSEKPQARGWFGWFKNDNPSIKTLETQNSEQESPQNERSHSLDGSIDEFVERDEDDDHSRSSYAPTSRHASEDLPEKKTRLLRQQTTNSANNDSKPATNLSAKLQSFLLPPSYPSDPMRNPSVLLSTSGSFTNIHFRTLNILHRKSARSRFHAPSYPDEIRPSIIELVGKWELHVDETATMGDSGLFDFSIGAVQARVLERFMREVEHGYHQQGIENVVWGWTAEDLAEKLGRIAIGEIVRIDEREAKKSSGGIKERG